MYVQELQGRIRIFLETVYLLMNTKNNTILNHRNKLIEEQIPAIAEYENDREYSKMVNYKMNTTEISNIFVKNQQKL